MSDHDQPNRDTFEIVKAVCGWIAGALLMIVVGVTGTAYTGLKSEQDVMRSQLLTLQKDSITEDKLKDTEARINSNMQTQLGFIRNEIQTTNRNVERMLDRLDKQSSR